MNDNPSRMEYLLHLAQLEADLQAALIRALAALHEAEETYRRIPTTQNAERLVWAGYYYQVALTNRNALYQPRG